jgi:site-specific recombinase XerD
MGTVRRSTEDRCRHGTPQCSTVAHSPRQQWPRLAGVRQFSKWLAAEGEIDSDPLLRLNAPKGDMPITSYIDYWSTYAERFLADEHPRSFNPLAVTKKLTTAYRPYRPKGLMPSGLSERLAQSRGFDM